jgi:hypothetical protein
MKIGRDSGLYALVLIVSSVGATQPSPPSTSTALSLSWFSMK